MATTVKIDEFAELHQRYLRANARMVDLQNAALMKMREIGVGCAIREAKAEFVSLKVEIEGLLARIKAICDNLA